MMSCFLTVIYIILSLSGLFAAPSNNSSKFSLFKPHIVGGSNVQGNIPYQISVRLDISGSGNPSYLEHFCGGSLIQPAIVLTAAHCLIKYRSDELPRGLIYVVAGTNLKRFNPADTFVTPVVAAIIHPLYNNDGNSHDVAVLKLKHPAPINNINLGLIPLRTSPTEKNSLCLISGWGTLQFGNMFGASYLQSATVPIVATSECAEKYGSNFKSDMICAGFETGGVDSCQGDSGGPLVCDNTLAGVVSWGIKCGLPSFPGVYASVPYHKKWIDEAIVKLRTSTPNPSTSNPPTSNPSTSKPSTPNPSIPNTFSPTNDPDSSIIPISKPSSVTKLATNTLTYALISTVIFTHLFLFFLPKHGIV